MSHAADQPLAQPDQQPTDEQTTGQQPTGQQPTGLQPTGQQPPGPSRGARVGRTPLLVVCAVLSVVLIAVAVVSVVLARRTSAADKLDQDRSAASAVAEQFALRMDNFDGTDLKAYTGAVNKLLTTKAKAQFGKQFESFQQVYSQGKAKGQGKVLLTGVGDADADTASVLVIHDAQVTSSFGDATRHYRWTIKLNKVGGRWLVDDFTPAS